MGQSNVVRAAGRSGRHGVRLMLLSLLVAGSAAVSMTAWSHEGGGPAMQGGHQMMHRGAGGLLSDRMLDGLNVSDAQRAQIKQIMQAAAEELKGQREAARALRQRGMQIFAAPTVDPAAAESVRQQLVAQHDAASRRMLQAMLDASRVLTPEQRAKLGERVQERSARMQERMKRHHGDAATQ